MTTIIDGTAGVTFPAGGVGNPASAVVGLTDTQTLTNKTLTTPSFNSAQVQAVSGTAPLYFTRAWVNFAGTGTPAIRASGNVTSITDNSTGEYTVNFTTAMPDANYSVSVDMQPSVSNAGSDTFPTNYTTTSIEVRHFEDGIVRDSAIVNVSVFR